MRQHMARDKAHSPRERYDRAQERLAQLHRRLAPPAEAEQQPQNIPITPDILEELAALESEAEEAFAEMMMSAEKENRRARR